jgi:hypothetical protein
MATRGDTTSKYVYSVLAPQSIKVYCHLMTKPYFPAFLPPHLKYTISSYKMSILRYHKIVKSFNNMRIKEAHIIYCYVVADDLTN